MWVCNASAQVDQHSKYPMFISVCVVTNSMMVAAVSLRAYIRIRSCRIGWDDCYIFVAAFFTIVYTADALCQTRLGLGLPLALRPADNLHDFALLNYAGRPIYVAALAAFKIAACCGALRVIKGTNRRTLRFVIKRSRDFIILSHVAVVLALMLYCRPVRKGWSPHTPGKCLSPGPLFYSTAGVTILCDLIAFSLPLTVLLPLRNLTRDRTRLVAFFFFGFFTTICSIIRMTEVRTVVKNGDSTNLILWGVIEACVGVIMSSIPTLNGMISGLGKPEKAPSNASYGADTYRELPSAGNELRELIELSQIMCTREYMIEESRKQDSHETVTVAPTS